MLAEVDEKQQLVSGLEELLGQFSKLADDVSVVESEQEIQQAGEQLSEVSDKLRSWRARLEVFAATQRCTVYIRLSCRSVAVCYSNDTGKGLKKHPAIQ